MIAVDVAGTQGKALGFGSYLGETYDETAGTVREMYAKQLDAEISLEVRAPAAADCELAMETVADTLLEGLPSGLKPWELSWESVSWDRSNRMFLRKGKLKCRATFTAVAGEDSKTLLDFILKGVITN